VVALVIISGDDRLLRNGRRLVKHENLDALSFSSNWTGQ
jgi:hypothetical protein